MTEMITYPPGLQAAAAELGVILPKSEKFTARNELIELSEDFSSMHGDDDSDFGGFSFKKLGRGIGKIGKGIGKGIGKIAKNPIAQALNPALAITAHTTSKALGGKGVIKGPLGKIVDAGTNVATAGGMGALGKKFGPVVTGLVKKTGIANGHAVAFAIPSPHINIKQAMAGADKLLGDPNVKNAAAVVRNTKAFAALGDPSAKRGLAVLTAVGHIRLAAATPAGKKAIPTPLLIKPTALTVKKAAPAVRALAVKKVATAPKKHWWNKVVEWFKV